MNPQLLSIYRDRFAADIPKDEFTYTTVLSMLNRAQRKYNEFAKIPCRGFTCFKLWQNGGPNQRCGHPMCPTCWHRNLTRIFEGFSGLPESGFYYVRQTAWEKWDTAIHARCKARFKGNGSRYRLLGYLVSYAACGLQIDFSDIEQDPFQGEMTYSYVGLFVSEHFVRDTDLSGDGQIEVRLTAGRNADIVGVIHQDRYRHRDDAIQGWLDQMTPPFRYRAHPAYETYIRVFETRRDPWNRLNRAIIRKLQKHPVSV